jgi:hypothetical protein
MQDSKNPNEKIYSKPNENIKPNTIGKNGIKNEKSE